MNCSAACLELVSQDPGISPGPVQDNEDICRAAYEPNHGKPGKIKPGFLVKKHLVAGTLSVWRVSERANLAVEELRQRLRDNGPAGAALMAVLAATALEIRSIRLQDDGPRAFCVVDECDIDTTGGKHAAHAHIKLCPNAFQADPIDTLEFLQAFNDLADLFRRRLV